MLTQLIALLEGRRNALGLYEISRALHAQPGAVQGMLELLVQRGRLIEVGPDGGCCTTCGEQTQCSLLAARGKRYVIATPLAPEFLLESPSASSPCLTTPA